MANYRTKKVADVWTQMMNPLRGLTKQQIEQMLEQARRCNDVRLQVAFEQIEQAMPIFGICINKRTAGVCNREWRVSPMDSSKEARDQARYVQAVMRKSDARNLDGLTEAIRHLTLATFRGRACVKPFIGEDGSLYFKKLNNWNVLEKNNRLYWCPDVSECRYEDIESLDEIPEYEVCWLKDSRPIDVPGIQIYLRQLVGEEQWARFIEKEGIPQVLITAPEGTPDSAMTVWNQRAVNIFEGGSGVMPSGSKVDVLTTARGQDPFSLFVRHQMEMIAILATGGTLATIGGSTGMGSNLTEIQNDQFQSLINYDCKRIANALTNVVIRKICRKLLGTDKVLCRFEFVEQAELTPDKYLAMAQMVVNMGMQIDVGRFKDLTGIDFIKDDDAWTPVEKPVQKEWTAYEKDQLKKEMEDGV